MSYLHFSLLSFRMRPDQRFQHWRATGQLGCLGVLYRTDLWYTIPHLLFRLCRAHQRSSRHFFLSTRREDGVLRSPYKPVHVQRTPCVRRPQVRFVVRHSRGWCDGGDDRRARTQLAIHWSIQPRQNPKRLTPTHLKKYRRFFHYCPSQPQQRLQWQLSWDCGTAKSTDCCGRTTETEKSSSAAPYGTAMSRRRRPARDVLQSQ